MKMLIIAMLLMVLSATQALSAPVGTRASQFTTMTVTIDQSNYGFDTLATYTHTSQGIAVSSGQGPILSPSQPAGPDNGSLYSLFFTIPDDIIRSFY